MRETTTAVPPLAWSRTYPGRADHVGEARRFLASVLDDWPAILCLSELAANAATHSNSREPGGQFTIRASVRHRDLVRVEVEDQGGPWINPACTDGQHGRGLFIVSQLASDWGISGDGRGGWTVWFEIACPLSGCAANGNCGASHGLRGPGLPACPAPDPCARRIRTSQRAGTSVLTPGCDARRPAPERRLAGGTPQ